MWLVGAECTRVISGIMLIGWDDVNEASRGLNIKPRCVRNGSIFNPMVKTLKYLEDAEAEERAVDI